MMPFNQAGVTMHARDPHDGPQTPQQESAAPSKRAWSAPQLTMLDAKETLSGAPSTIEETPINNKPGS
jgi:hypothetical protein